MCICVYICVYVCMFSSVVYYCVHGSQPGSRICILEPAGAPTMALVVTMVAIVVRIRMIASVHKIMGRDDDAHIADRRAYQPRMNG